MRSHSSTVNFPVFSRLLSSWGDHPSRRASSEKDSLKINPAEAERVRYIFDRYTEYRNLSAVAELCRLRGYTGKRGKVQTAESIRRVLTCPVYAGYNSYKGQLYKGRHAPIISVKDYNRVQRILQQRGKRVRILYQQIVG